jgi:hypothetical protein
MSKDMRKIIESVSSMYSVNEEPKRQAAAVKSPASNDIFIDSSEEFPDRIGITLKGRTALISAERARKLAERLESLASEIIGDKIEEENVSVSNNFGIEPAEKHTKYDPPGTNYSKNTSARRGMVGG